MVDSTRGDPVVENVEIDLHTRLLPGAAGHLANRLDLFDDPVRYDIAGSQVLALPPHLRLLQAAAQNVLGSQAEAKWSSDADVLVLAHHAERARSSAERAGLQWVLSRGLERAFSAAELVMTPGAEPSTSWEDRLMARVYGRERIASSARFLAEASVAPPMVTARIIKSVLFPGSDYLASRGRTRSDHLRRQLERPVAFFRRG